MFDIDKRALTMILSIEFVWWYHLLWRFTEAMAVLVVLI
jgi:hypothetical protein